MHGELAGHVPVRDAVRVVPLKELDNSLQGLGFEVLEVVVLKLLLDDVDVAGQVRPKHRLSVGGAREPEGLGHLHQRRRGADPVDIPIRLGAQLVGPG